MTAKALAPSMSASIKRLLLLLLLIFTSRLLGTASALSMTAGTGTGTGGTTTAAVGTQSPWSPSSWRITLNVGREPASSSSSSAATSMPEKDWGASGARLVLNVNVAVTADTLPPPVDDVVGRGAMTIRPIGDAPTFVNAQGQQTVRMDGGGWRISLPQGGLGHASTLRFYLDVCDEARRNDVTLPPGRLYFSAPCWREGEFERGKAALAPLVAEATAAQRRLDEQLSHETGDRRLDGTDPLDTVLAYKDMAELVANRDDRVRRLREAEQVLPPRNADSTCPIGPWPGTTEGLAIGPGSVVVRRKKLLLGEEVHVLGTWEAIPVWEGVAVLD